MSHNVSLASWSAEIVDVGTQYTDEACSIPLGESEASTSSSDTEQDIYPSSSLSLYGTRIAKFISCTSLHSYVYNYWQEKNL